MGWLTDGDSGKYSIRGRYIVIVADKVYSGVEKDINGCRFSIF